MRTILFFLFIAFAGIVYGQNSAIEGVVLDKSTGESLIGANIVFKDNPGKGIVANLDGEFVLPVAPGKYIIVISYVGYRSEERLVRVGDGPTTIKVELNSLMLDEVLVTADIAVDRKTPIAHMTIKPTQLEEELAGQDLPMILNSTPGAYATDGGGGEGDAEIRIRGFKGNFVGVLLDGIPVNDMENGWVYWSNWFGLNTVTRSVNIQRGLGASKLAIPSIGGTFNILTKGIDDKKEFRFNEELDNSGKVQRNAGFNSGNLKDGWSITAAVSHKKGSGWVDRTDFEGYFYFLKVNKRHKKHLFSFTTFGAPQWHEQRDRASRIASYDSEYAKKMGVDLNDPAYLPHYFSDSDGDGILEKYSLLDKGIEFNSQWGYLRRDRTNPNASLETMHTGVNEYYKPMFYLKDFWTINDRMSLSSVLYVSIGRGGGVSGIAEMDGSGAALNKYTVDGQMDVQSFYDQNTKPINTGFGIEYPIDANYHPTMYRSRFVVPMNVNEHEWYGALSTFNYRVNDNLEVDAGIDIRHYSGTHYRKVYDLLGGDYYVNTNGNNEMIGEGGRFYFDNTATVSWGGMFYQAEYSTPLYTALINVTGNVSSFMNEDFMKQQKSKRKTLFGFTAKGGFNYNFAERMNAFVNAGYLNKVQGSKYIYSGHSVNFTDIDNEEILSAEIGTMFKGGKLKATVNAYLTHWDNRPGTLSGKDFDNSDAPLIATVGLTAIHKGVEMDLTYNPIKQVAFESWVSFGDWKWETKKKDIPYYNASTGVLAKRADLNLVGVHVSDAPQTQVGLGVRFMPIKGMYVSVKSTYFDRYYADFNPDDNSFDADNARDSWKVPSYQIFDLHAGYRFSLKGIEKVRFNLGVNVLNFTDELYISSARNNDGYTTGGISPTNFDAGSAIVYFGAPRRIIFNFGLQF